MTNKRLLVIWNAKAGAAADAARLRRDVESRPGATVVEAESYTDAVAIVAQKAGEADVVVAAGGDGTVNAVINGLMKRPEPPPLAILPLGTGNNLCRVLGIPLEPSEAVELIDRSVTRNIDLVEARTAAGDTFFANVASAGNSERIIESLTDRIKESWGAWCYLRSAVPVMANLRSYELRMRLDDGPTETHTMWNLIVANAHLAASGLPVAPRARMDDGLLDVIVVLDGTPLDTTRLTAEFLMGDYLDDDRVVYRTARRVHIETTPDLGFIVDGEFRKAPPYTFVVKPGALRVFVSQPKQYTTEGQTGFHFIAEDKQSFESDTYDAFFEAPEK
ncbi:MAG: diacylglycerol kinase family lipid kinase [Planctomycetes bacterium]|nr:diacylglycerol kinase family lipid kinase [Planctomycetota bacterium]